MPLPARVPALSAALVLAFAWLDTTNAAETAVPTASAAQLLCADGRSGTGDVHLSGSALAVGSCTCPLDRIVQLNLPGEVAGTIDQGVVLTDGTVLRGVPVHLAAGKLQLRSDLLGDLSIDRTLVAAIALGPFHPSQARELAAGEAGVRFPNGEHFDGPVDYLNIREVGIDSGLRVRPFLRARIQSVVLAPCAPAAGTWIQLAGGDLLNGAITAWDADHLGFASSLKSTLSIPLVSVRELWSAEPNLQPLDALHGTETDVPLPTIVASAACGALAASRRLRIGLRHGIITCAGSSLRFDEVAGWATLTGEVAAAAGSHGVSCTLLADDKQVFTSGALSDGEPPKSFTVQVAGARHLTLVTSCTPEAGTGAVVWRWPTLVK